MDAISVRTSDSNKTSSTKIKKKKKLRTKGVTDFLKSEHEAVKDNPLGHLAPEAIKNVTQNLESILLEDEKLLNESERAESEEVSQEGNHEVEELYFVRQHLSCVYKQLVETSLLNISLTSKLNEQRRKARRRLRQSWVELTVNDLKKTEITLINDEKMWMVYTNGIIVAYKDSEDLSTPEEIMDLHNSKMECMHNEKGELSGIKLSCTITFKEWIMKSHKGEILQGWSDLLSRPEITKRPLAQANPVSRISAFNLQLSEQYQELIDLLEVENPVLEGKLKEISQNMNACFEEIIKELVLLQIK